MSNAVNKWNAEPGGVNILLDTWQTTKDLEIFDQYSSDNWASYFNWNPLADNIKFNTRVFDQSSWHSSHEKKVALHEFGHALDFDHNSLSWPQSIMRQGKQSQTYLGTHDKSDYADRWGG